MKEIIHVDASGLGRLCCDAPGCGYVSDGSERPFGPHLIGKPCPCCGADLLTVRDYKATMGTMRLVKWINTIFGPLFGSEPTPERLARGRSISVHHHDGTTTITYGPDRPQ